MSQCPTVAKRLQLRHDTLANWSTANTQLLVGEIGIETDTNKMKIGDGSTRWNSLPYFASTTSSVAGPAGPQGSSSTVAGPTGAQGPQGLDSTVTGPTGISGPQGLDSTVTGPTGLQGPTGPMAPAIVFDGGLLGASFPYGPVLDCGGIFQSP